jgi:anti-sigma B factor antagonist
MEIVQRQVGDVTVLDLSGKITSTDSDGRLKEKVTGLVTEGHKKVVLNLSDVSFIDSSGLGETVACYTTAKGKGGEVKLVGATTRTKNLLVMTKLITVFDHHDKLDEAVAAFK